MHLLSYHSIIYHLLYSALINKTNEVMQSQNEEERKLPLNYSWGNVTDSISCQRNNHTSSQEQKDRMLKAGFLKKIRDTLTQNAFICVLLFLSMWHNVATW